MDTGGEPGLAFVGMTRIEAPGTTPAAASEDPPLDAWAERELPETWPDRLDFRRPAAWWRFFSHVAGLRREPVRLPDDLPGADRIPKYVLQEFHGLPGGNFSRCVTHGYSQGFDRVMLGTMAPARASIALALAGSESVLDVGCGAGHTAIALRRAGVPDVWGLDPSPYLLQHAARSEPDVSWLQGVVEEFEFADERFDGVSVCFVFHEMPPRQVARGLEECLRVLRPGGRLVLVEPSALQFLANTGSLLRRFGWRGLYFRGLARFVHEPFLRTWHQRAPASILRDHGFEVLADEQSCPLHRVVARKPA